MTTVRQIYQLQEIDHEISRVRGLIASVEGQVGDRSELDQLESELDAARVRVQDLTMEQRRLELEAESLRPRVQSGRQKLYGGAVTNLREVEALGKEIASLEAELQRSEESLLETMMALEEGQAAIVHLEAQQRDRQQTWQADQAALTTQWKELGNSLEEMERRRQGCAEALPPQGLGLYESLRASKAGVAVARVERGLCRGCLVALPTHQLQRARTSQEPVQCDSCGRILFVS